jgi:phenylalanyl-tRNA synthetase alpha chain
MALPEFLADLDSLARDAAAAFEAATDATALEAARIEFLGAKSGRLKTAQKGLGQVGKDDKPAAGKHFNEVKQAIEAANEAAKLRLASVKTTSAEAKRFDATVPGQPIRLGHLHPITQTIDELKEIMGRLGFSAVEGPEVEDPWHNFEALNIPLAHPARDPLENFYLAVANKSHGKASSVPLLLRSQIEGLLIDRNVTMADLKSTLRLFARSAFDPDVHIRFRPSFFPFTEPSVEVDMSWRGGWIEMGGAGMVDPNVLRAVGYDPDEYTGFAFGLGIERICARRHKITDIRELFKNDVRFLQQF